MSNEITENKPIPRNIPIAEIKDLPGANVATQPDKSYGGLVSSILIDGVKEPVILRQSEDGEYQLVTGYRRRRAAELAKLKELPALVYDMTTEEALDYRTRAELDPKTPVPGKLIAPEEKEQDKETAKKPAAKSGKARASSKKEQPAKEEKAEKPEQPKPEKESPEEEPNEKKEEPEEEKPVGTAAVGPTGTIITKILEQKLNPPTAKDKKSIPVPGEDEAFSVILHPAYLKKADINTFSIDRESDDFKELYKSIERFGVKDPVLARVGKDRELEILSGQRRHLIASELNYPVPTIIQQLDDDDARILVADGNLHREHISTYDLSRAVKMKSESMKRKVGRHSRDYAGPRREYTDELIAKEMGMSESKLNRLMKLSEATRSICDLVDDNTIPLSVAYNIAFLEPKMQDTVADLVGINVKVNNENTQLLKKVADKEPLDEKKIRDVLEGNYPPRVVEKPKPVPVAAPVMTPASELKTAPVPTDISGPTKNVVIPFAPPEPTRPAQSVPATATPAPSGTSTVKAPETDRENSYETKIVLRGDRLRKYFPDVSMTPLEIEESVYSALEERRQRLEKAKQKAELFAKKEPVK